MKFALVFQANNVLWDVLQENLLPHISRRSLRCNGVIDDSFVFIENSCSRGCASTERSVLFAFPSCTKTSSDTLFIRQVNVPACYLAKLIDT